MSKGYSISENKFSRLAVVIVVLHRTLYVEMRLVVFLSTPKQNHIVEIPG